MLIRGGDRPRHVLLVKEQHAEVSGGLLKHLNQNKRRVQSSSRSRVYLGRGSVKCFRYGGDWFLSKRLGVLNEPK